MEVLQPRAGSLNIKRLLLMKENQIAWVKEFSAFPSVGRCESLGSLKSLLSCACQLPGASVPPLTLALVPWDRRYCSPSWVPGGQESL